MEKRQMVCEGRCNPQRIDVEARVPRASMRLSNITTDGERVVKPVSAQLAAELRRLVHTAHTFSFGRWTCETCGASRD